MTKPKSAPKRSPPRRQQPPIEVQIRRGDIAESEHVAVACVVDRAGETVAAYGDAERIIYPRSTIKPLQAMPLIETGAADSFGLNDEEIALACASHSGERVHLGIAETWLRKLDLDPEALVCGAHLPYDESAARELLAHAAAPTTLHNNCSGKHLGMLTTALHCGDSLPGYERSDHPVQQLVRDLLADLLDRSLATALTAIDGCSIPTIAVSVRDIAAMMAKLLADDTARPDRATAARRIVRVVSEHPDLIAGSGRFCTDITRATGGEIVVKSGAEGVAIALLRDQGMAIAVKSLDGARRAAEAAMATLVPLFAPVIGGATAAFARHAAPAIENWRGIRTGAVQVVLAN